LDNIYYRISLTPNPTPYLHTIRFVLTISVWIPKTVLLIHKNRIRHTTFIPTNSETCFSFFFLKKDNSIISYHSQTKCIPLSCAMIVHNSNDVRFKSEQSFFKKNVYALPFLAWRLLFSPHRLSLFKLDFPCCSERARSALHSGQDKL
jgi:hypothetical protein